MESRYDIDIDARLFFLKNETKKNIVSRLGIDPETCRT